ncbi:MULTISPECIES: hypothetical protein [Actinosynnema]|uniref:hypothetical protein n=1 Tax=Actinosynnema TaxID=40566 RepID=UPI0020A29A97|nr:hypothetical protein [Actinosynnema pretiosum]MCP2092770.1 hypothetical protein [Actinosynnema pretiosum]
MTRRAEAVPSRVARSARLALLAEVLLVGVLVCLAALPVVTALASAGAGARALRGLVVGGRTPTARGFAADLVAGLRDPLALALPPLLVVVGALDVLALLGGLPGGAVLGPAIGLALVAVVVVLLRCAALWEPGARWSALLASPPTGPVGGAAVACALVVVVLVVLQAPGFAVVAPGLLVFASVAVVGR